MPNFKIHQFKEISSTNDKAKELASNADNNFIVVAEKQTKGRGRFGRKWNSRSGGLYLTLVLKERNLGNVKYLTFLAAISVAKSISGITDLKTLVKWPNDVLIEEKKVCGILTEIISGKELQVFVGIGINVNQRRFSKDIKKIATSIYIESRKKNNIDIVMDKVIKNFNILYDYYLLNEFGKIIDEWKKISHTLGKNVKVKTQKGTLTGEAIDIDKDCNLVLKLSNGKLKKISEGDVASY